MNERWPVVVGLGEVTQRDGALDPAGLMDAALRLARADAGAALGPVDVVMVPRGMWRHPDPGRAAALANGSVTVRSVIAEIGVLQQTLLSRAFAAIAEGEAEVCAVVGAEARHRSLRGGEESPGDGSPDEVLRPDGEIITRLEVERGLGVPAHQYALIESVLAHRAARQPAAQTRALSDLWALGARAAAVQPNAWRSDAPGAAAISSDAGGNRMIATPYRKWLVSDWNVDQASALLVTSVGAARAAGIPADRWIVPVAAAESNHMVPVSERAEPARSPAMEAVGDALASVGGAVAGADLIEIYSCFPAAVQVQAAALRIDPWTGWTVSGGMTFGGGPLNNFVLQATAAVARALRDGRGHTALVTSVSGMITKVGAVAWQRELVPAGEPGSLHLDVTADAAKRTEVRPVQPDLAGALEVVAHTVAHDRGQPAQAIVLAESPTRVRTIATSADPSVMAALAVEDHVGRRADVADGVLTRIL